MGTSSSSRGTRSRTPKVPSSVDRTEATSSSQGGTNNKPPKQQKLPPIPAPEGGQRFRSTRTNLRKYIETSEKRYLARSLKNYVSKGLGGSKNATRRMAPSRAVASNLLGFIQEYKDVGADQVLERFNLTQLSGKSAIEVLQTLTDLITPPGGPVDEAVPRNALLESIVELEQIEKLAFEDLTVEQLESLFADFIARTIEKRLLHTIGERIFTESKSPDYLPNIEQQIVDYIRGRVKDSMSQHFKTPRTKASIEKVVEKIYANSFSLLEVLTKEEI